MLQVRGNSVVAQFEKVKRNGDKWKLSLRGGIAHLDGRDYAFLKAEVELTY